LLVPAFRAAAFVAFTRVCLRCVYSSLPRVWSRRSSRYAFLLVSFVLRVRRQLRVAVRLRLPLPRWLLHHTRCPFDSPLTLFACYVCLFFAHTLFVAVWLPRHRVTWLRLRLCSVAFRCRTGARCAAILRVVLRYDCCCRRTPRYALPLPLRSLPVLYCSRCVVRSYYFAFALRCVASDSSLFRCAVPLPFTPLPAALPPGAFFAYRCCCRLRRAVSLRVVRRVTGSLMRCRWVRFVVACVCYALPLLVRCAPLGDAVALFMFCSLRCALLLFVRVTVTLRCCRSADG